MSKDAPGQEAQDFVALVRDALAHLYDAAYLRRHPLKTLLRPAGGPDAPEARDHLFRCLLEAIDSLRPPVGSKAASPARRKHNILELRYVQGLDAQEVMRRVSLGKTQYYRDQTLAVAAVAAALQERLPERQGTEPTPPAPAEYLSEALSEAQGVAVKTSPELVDLAAALKALLAPLHRACKAAGIRVTVRLARGLQPVHVDRAILRQVVLGLVSMGLECQGASGLVVSLRLNGSGVQLRFEVEGGQGQTVAPGAAGHSPVEAEVFGLLAKAMGGSLTLPETGEGPCPWVATLDLPTVRRPLLLVVDNNADFVTLVARCLTERQWDVIGASSVAEAKEVLRESKPNAILLDVMMPRQDGWQLLADLKANPRTRDLPVVVCSVLYEPRIATAMGAAGCLAKPIEKDLLFKTLEPFQTALLVGEASHSARPQSGRRPPETGSPLA